MSSTSRGDGVIAFFALACAITWICAAPLAWSFWQRVPPPAYAPPLAGLSAFGPTLAAVVVAWRRGGPRQIFGPWRTSLAWIVLALFTPFLVQTAARLIDLALGHPPTAWVLLPPGPEQLIALVMFPIGEEFGWRGFAQSSMVARYGPVKGALALGLVWGLWHLVMFVDPATGRIDLDQIATLAVFLPLYSILFVWMMDRAGGSMAVAIALHAGSHLDNLNNAPSSEWRLRLLTYGLVGVVAVFAGRDLVRRARLLGAGGGSRW